MSEKTHYKESPYDERIEELALDIEAAKGKAQWLYGKERAEIGY